MKLTRTVLYLFFLTTLVQCAKPGTPTGGAKDSIPPRLVNASPKMKTTEFDKTEIRLNFDEYVTLKDLSKQMIVSPPLEREKYTVYPQTGASKKVTIKLKDSLLENTTYTFNFGESIVDFNESNPSSYLTYTLSTGATIDSLYIRGNITDAFENETERFISLQLYPVDSIFTDSVIYSQKPLYVTSTLDTTIYRFQNLRAGKYAIIALEDKAGNYFFDQNMDKIGFNEKLIELPKDSVINLRLFKERRNFVVKSLNNIKGINCLTPNGAFYVFPSCKQLLGKKTKLKTDSDFVEKLLEKANVAVVQGSAFGLDGYFRISYATSMEKLKIAMERIKSFCESLE